MYSRLGNPEAINMLAMLKTRTVDVFQPIVERQLSKLKLEFTNEDAVVVKVVAPSGYPEKREKAKGHPVQVFETNIKRNGCYLLDRKSTRLNSSHLVISYAVFCLKKKKK